FALACLIGITLWNAAEILLRVWWSLRQRGSLYFWSIITAALGILICVISQVIKLEVPSQSGSVALAIGSAGWVPMVTGQSVVLYSRLHLLWDNARLLRYILAIILINAVILHIPTITVGIVAASTDSSPQIIKAYTILERVQVTIFFLQELCLSGLYLWRCTHFQKQYGRRMGASDTAAMTKMLWSLIAINLVVTMLDCSVLALEYLNLYVVQLTAKNFVYSVKLKMELSVLNSLRDYVQ
ncbi:hypothetical protein M406DRAFT_221185, partial [Cryphonectria parasitica EP155]